MDVAVETLALALEREEFAAVTGDVVFLRARPHEALRRFGDRLVCEQTWKPSANLLQAARLSNSPEERTGEAEADLVLLLPGRTREQVLYDFARGLRLLRPGGTLLAVLPNDWGAARFEKLLASATGAVETLSKHHCRAFWTRKTDALDTALLDEWLAGGAARPLESDPRFLTRPGVFSARGVDPGSRALAAQLPAGLSGRVADLGAGWGFLSHFLLAERPQITDLHLYEADAQALELARQNLAPLQRPDGPTVAFEWHDVTQGLGFASFDAVVMNPPFHSGRDSDPLLGRQFLAAGIGALRPGGQLWVVANQFLPYERFLADALPNTRLVWQEHGYKVLTGSRDKASDTPAEGRPRTREERGSQRPRRRKFHAGGRPFTR